MTAPTKPDVHSPETWGQVDEPGLLVLCPVCVVAVPMDNAQAHYEVKHAIQAREAITHITPTGIVLDFLHATYEAQIAALHAEQYWEQDLVERALGAIYVFQRTNRLSCLVSTWEAIQRAAVEWYHG